MKRVNWALALLVTVMVSSSNLVMAQLHNDADTGKWIKDGFDVQKVTNIGEQIIRMGVGHGGSFGTDLIVTTYEGKRVYRINSGGQKTLVGQTPYVISGIASPNPGSAFGDYVYLGAGTSYYSGDSSIYRMDSQGHVEKFFDGHNFLGETMGAIGFAPPNSPYGNYLYTYDRGSQQIYRIDANGTATTFTSLGNELARDIIFDTTGQFDNQLLVVSGQSGPGNIYKVAPDGSKTTLQAGAFYKGGGAVTPLNSPFGGKLYVVENYWPSLPCDIYSVSPNGSYEIFARNFNSWDESSLVYGADGNLYTFDRNIGNGTGEIYRIVPEPAMLSMLVLGGLTLLRRRKS
ncbi:MAG: PEP-CTERM sorting domain-containing protein [Phycisphaerae bacterium]